MEEKPIQRILLVVEGADLDHAVATAAIGQAIAHRARLVAVHVVDHMVINRVKRLSDQSSTELEIELEEKGWKALYLVEETAKDRGVPILILQKRGAVETEILNEALRLNVDLIVVGQPPKLPGQAKRLSQGWMEKVIENAECSVWIVKVATEHGGMQA